MKDLDIQTGEKFEHNCFEKITIFSCLDNNLIDSVYSNLNTMNNDNRQINDAINEEELVHHLRKITKELNYILDLDFVRFWGYIVKFPMFMEFLDDYLLNMRKYNDMEKIQIDLDQSFNNSKLSTSGPDL